MIAGQHCFRPGRSIVKVLRTPDDRFENLPGYPFEPCYTEVSDVEGGRLRIHHVDEGAREGEIVLWKSVEGP